MAVTTETQIVREAPELEAIKLNLLSEAAKLAYRPEFGGQLPEYQVASFSPAQAGCLQAGMQQGIGSYLPYIEAGNVALGQGLGATQVGQIAAAGAAGTCTIPAQQLLL
jgi:phage baseplate assembly protein W